MLNIFLDETEQNIVFQKFHAESEYYALWDCHRKSDKVRMAAKFAADCQRREGRHKIRVKFLVSPFSG